MFESINLFDAYDDIIDLIIDYKLSSLDQKQLVLDLLKEIGQLPDDDLEHVRDLMEANRLVCL